MNEMTRIAKDTLKDINGFIGNNNYNVIKVEEGYCELEGIISETSYNNMNIVHGGYIFGLADTASASSVQDKAKYPYFTCSFLYAFSK